MFKINNFINELWSEWRPLWKCPRFLKCSLSIFIQSPSVSFPFWYSDARPHQSLLLRLRLWKQKVQQKRPSDALCGFKSSCFWIEETEEDLYNCYELFICFFFVSYICLYWHLRTSGHMTWSFQFTNQFSKHIQIVLTGISSKAWRHVESRISSTVEHCHWSSLAAHGCLRSLLKRRQKPERNLQLRLFPITLEVTPKEMHVSDRIRCIL